MSDDYPPTDHDDETPRIVTTDGACLTFDRVWITERTGYVCGVNDDGENIRRYPPHRVRVVVEGI